MISIITAGGKIDCDENVITTDHLLLRPKNICDGLYEPLAIGLNVVVYAYTVHGLEECNIQDQLLHV